MANRIEFKLFAPNNKGAALLGDFSDWKEIPMQKDKDGYFRTQVELEDGTYLYKFRIQSCSPLLQPDRWVYVIDPYATEVRDEQNSVVRIKDGKKVVDNYIWQHDDKPLSVNEELVIYELHVADFSGGEDDSEVRGKFKDVTDKLDYLSELGINAIELMPVNEYPGDYSWGYKVRHFFATKSSYGSTEDLKQLIDECHARGIRVIMDGIYNHTDEECPLLLIDRDYWYYQGKHYPEDDPRNYWGPEFNYENYDEKLGIKPAWEYVGDIVRFWIQEYHIDGIRFDAVRQLANYDFLYWITNESRKASGGIKPFYNIAEYIPDTAKIVTPQGPMDSCWHESFRFFVMQDICGDAFDLEKLKEALDAKRQGYAIATSVINYLATHDREHTIAELDSRKIASPASFGRAKLGAVLLLTAMGVPMLWMGEEFGENTRKATNQINKLEWPLLKQDLNRDLLEYYKALIALRQQNPALHTENINFFHENPDSKVLAYVRWNEQGSRVVVVANFSDKYLAGYQVPHFPASGNWHSLLDNHQVEAVDGTLTIDLPEYEAKVLVWQ